MIEFYHGEPVMIDYTPAQDVGAGTLVDVGSGNLVVTHRDIKANELGAGAVQNGCGIYKVPLEDAATFAIGAAVLVDPATGLAGASGTAAFGWAVEAAAKNAGAIMVKVCFQK